MASKAAGPSLLSRYQADVEAYVKTLLEPYIEALKGRKVGSIGIKEINDPVWGTLTLLPHEVIVLDSPLVQRLSRIRQLGVAHFVYPAGIHTRLSHSLGTLHQIDRLVESMNKNSSSTESTGLISDAMRHTLRLTALCHDIGHGVMSHVIENALVNNEACEDLRQEFRVSKGKDAKVQLSEMAVHFMLASPSFRTLVQEALRISKRSVDWIDPGHMASAVIGEKISDEAPLLHELISGPFDADKLDYMPRDATMCGVPIVTDVNRLIQKVRAVKLHENDLPEEIGRTVKKGLQYTLIGIARSGASTLDEVAIGRSLMFDKIYRHHKVRAVEAMVAAMCDQSFELFCSNPAMIPFALFDEELLGLDEATIKQRSGKRRFTAAQELGIKVTADIALRLRERRLFSRAYAFATVLPDDGYRGDASQRGALEALIRDADDSERRFDIVRKIVSLTEEIATLVGEKKELAVFPNGDLTPYVWLDPPANKTIDQKPDPSRAYLVDGNNGVRRVEQVNADTRAWADAYVNTRDLGYVFCPKEVGHLVHVATEVVLRETYGVRVAKTTHVYTKQTESLIENVRLALLDKGFYTRRSADLEPLPLSLQNADVGKRIVSLTEKFSGYLGPAVSNLDEGRVQEGRLKAGRVLDWAAQFGPDFAAPALSLLDHTMFIGRDEMNRALRRFLEANAGFRGSSIVPLGEPKDGSAVMAYYAGDAARLFGCEVVSLAHAVHRNAPIIFVDDFIGRGSSAISIVLKLLGETPIIDLHEHRSLTLHDSERDPFRKQAKAFVFTAGMDEGLDALEKALQKNGVTGLIHAEVRETGIPTVHSALLGTMDLEAQGKFVELAQEIGRQILDDGKPEHEEVWLQDRGLGYGNHALLLVSAYNTPTATLTALWADGNYLGRKWTPVFPRRKKN